MAFSTRLWGTFITLIYLQFISHAVPAQSAAKNDTNATEEVLPAFGDTVQILGAMERTDQDFKDGLALDIFSPKNCILVVIQNTSPLPTQFVTGNSGSSFVALSKYSYIITVNGTANDLIAKIEVPYDPTALQSIRVQEANTYVATRTMNNTGGPGIQENEFIDV